MKIVIASAMLILMIASIAEARYEEDLFNRGDEPYEEYFYNEEAYPEYEKGEESHEARMRRIYAENEEWRRSLEIPKSSPEELIMIFIAIFIAACFIYSLIDKWKTKSGSHKP